MHPEETTVYDALLTGTIVLGILVITFVVTIIRYQKRKILFHITRTNAEISSLEKERARIAGDLHDDLGASLSAIKLKLQCIAVHDEKERAILDQSESYIDETVLKLKRISFNMLPRVLERKGLETALSQFIDMIEQSSCIKIRFAYDCPLLNEQQSMHIYRIVQEILNNIVKHAGAAAATVTLQKIKKKIHVHITDDGRGFDKATVVKNDTGQGLQNIMARADLLRAAVFLTTEPGKGVDYLIQIPEVYDSKT